MVSRQLILRATDQSMPTLRSGRACIIQHGRGDLVRETVSTTNPEHTPRVTIILVTYLRAADISRCLDSLVAQTYKDFEVLICDDGSTDGTEEVVGRYARALNLRYLWSENSGGPARPR